MSERLSFGFADARTGIQGVAIAGVGTLLAVGEELSAAAPPQLEHDGERWRARSPEAYDLSLTSIGEGASLWGGSSQIWPCQATGTVGAQRIDGFAALTRATPSAATDFVLERSLTMLFDAELCFALAARRPLGASEHGEEELQAVVFRGEALEAAAIEKPRLSSTYDSAGLLARAGIELWESDESEFALRVGGEALAHGELPHPDGARTRVAFVAWHHSGRRGMGSYEITRAAVP